MMHAQSTDEEFGGGETAPAHRNPRRYHSSHPFQGKQDRREREEYHGKQAVPENRYDASETHSRYRHEIEKEIHSQTSHESEAVDVAEGDFATQQQRVHEGEAKGERA